MGNILEKTVRLYADGMTSAGLNQVDTFQQITWKARRSRIDDGLKHSHKTFLNHLNTMK